MLLERADAGERERISHLLTAIGYQSIEISPSSTTTDVGGLCPNIDQALQNT